MNMNVSIERLVLDGLPVTNSDGSIVQRAVEKELVRLLSKQDLHGISAGAVPFLSGGSVQLASNSKPVLLGHQIANALSASLHAQCATPLSFPKQSSTSP
jgi:hypothetical protein